MDVDNDQEVGPCYIQRLPIEILDEIFALTPPEIPSFNKSDSPLALTHVCRSWRIGAIQHTALWNTIYLPSPCDGLSRGLLQLYKLWIERSYPRPLSIDFHLASDYQPWKVTPEHIAAVEEVVDMLIPHTSRIVKLLRIFPRFLDDRFKLEDMSALDDLFICESGDENDPRPKAVTQPFKTPDALRCLSLRQTFFSVDAFSSLKSIAHLDLWQLQGAGQLSISSSVKLMRQLYWLESCTLDIARSNYAVEDLQNNLVMPNLSFMFFSWDWSVNVGPILDILQAPNLQRLGLRGPPPSRRPWVHLKQFLRRCKPALSQLSIKEIGYTDIRLLDCLKLAPSIMNFSLSHCAIDNNVVRALSLNNEIPVMNNILPMLEFLSFEACDTIDVHDLTEMMRSRGPYRQNHGRRLRSIRINNCRRIKESYVEELKSSGIENVVIRARKLSIPQDRRHDTRRVPGSSARNRATAA